MASKSKTRASRALARELSERLRSAREARGLSLRRTAQLAGIAVSYLHSLENGRALPTVQMLGTLMEVLPDLAADRAALLGAPSPGHFSAGAGTHAVAAETLGLACERVEASRRGLWMEGLRATHADASHDNVRLGLLRAAAQADGEVLRRLKPSTRRLRDGQRLHLFEWRGEALNYRLEAHRPLEWTCLIPARELLFSASRELSVTAISQTGGPDLADWLHPRRASLARGLARVDFPVVGVTYAAAPQGEAWSAPTGVAFRRHRRAAGLTQGQVAKVAGTSINAVSSFEKGDIGSPRIDHALGYLRAVPSFPPERLLPGPDPGTRPTAEQAFEQAVTVAGLCCEETLSEIAIAADGTRTLRITHRGLRAVHGDLAERELVLPRLLGAATQGAGPPTAAVSDLESPRVGLRSTHELADGQLTLRWTKRRGVIGVDLVRTYAPAKRYSMNEAEALAKRDLPTPVSGGATLPVHVPSRRVSLRIRLPPELSHGPAAAHLWPSTLFPDLSLPRWTQQPPPPLSVAALEGGGTELRAVVRDLTPGLKLGVGWE